jgi:hypothetical protein
VPSAPASLTVATTTKGETLAALDMSGSGTLFIVNIPAAGPAAATVVSQSVTAFADLPTEVLLSPGGRWAYVLEKDSTGKGYVQTVDAFAVELGQPNVLGGPVAIGPGPQSETLSQDGSHLYVPYFDPAQLTNGGVAILEVTQTDCSGIFQTLIDGCPDCDQGDCLVLATIKEYVYGSAVTDAALDNLTDRRLLASTLPRSRNAFSPRAAEPARQARQALPGRREIQGRRETQDRKEIPGRREMPDPRAIPALKEMPASALNRDWFKSPR